MICTFSHFQRKKVNNVSPVYKIALLTSLCIQTQTHRLRWKEKVCESAQCKCTNKILYFAIKYKTMF